LLLLPVQLLLLRYFIINSFNSSSLLSWTQRWLPSGRCNGCQATVNFSTAADNPRVCILAGYGSK
jgi:hypothetical protein